MAVLWRDVDVQYRETAAGQRQHEALDKFQKDAGLDATTAARAVGLSYPQYNRYLWGRLPLRTDQIARFAAAYGVPKSELTRALGLLDDAMDRPWSMREALHGQIPDGQIDALVERHKDSPVDDQRSAVAEVLDIASQQRAERTLKPRRDRPA